MEPAVVEEASGEKIPLRPESESGPENQSRINSSVDAAGKTLGTPVFLLSLVITAVIPFIQIIVGLKYKDQCRISSLIPTYMIVAGICGLIVVGILIFLSVTFMCLASGSVGLAVLGMCGACLSFLITIILGIFMFVWFILGCVWVFGVHNRVQYDDILQPQYCDPVLYKTAFTLLIITIVWTVFYCCLPCVRLCFGRLK